MDGIVGTGAYDSEAGVEYIGVEQAGAVYIGVEQAGAEYIGVEQAGAVYIGVEHAGATVQHLLLDLQSRLKSPACAGVASSEAADATIRS